MVLSFDAADEILKFDYSIEEIEFKVLSCDLIHYGNFRTLMR